MGRSNTGMAHTEMYAYPYAPECNKVQTLNCNALGKYVLGGADGQTRGADKFATLDIVNINRWLKRIAFDHSRALHAGLAHRSCTWLLRRGLTQKTQRRAATSSDERACREPERNGLFLRPATQQATPAINRAPLALIHAKIQLTLTKQGNCTQCPHSIQFWLPARPASSALR